uniref:Uncharacterized protein n=1 Tax=Arion vulgaris TaxID=1028688 RepID=A0A0B6Y8D5_9EUPU
MPIRPTTAVFITSSHTPVNASQFQPKKNPSTMLESLEETNEEDINDSTTTA